MDKQLNISVIIPVYNEAEVVSRVIDELKKFLISEGINHEIIAVDDASTDGTPQILAQKNGIKVISHPYNKGYGASLKTGASHALYDWLLFFDGDGQHRVACLKEFISQTNKYDLIVGSRQGYQGPLLRQPGKKIIRLLVNYLAGRNIPDFNCGLRLVKKELFMNFRHILPDGFSLSTTSTLAFLKEGLDVKFIPIEIDKRIGRSSLRTSDGFKTLMLVIRLIMLFSPLKIFFPLAAFGFTISIGWIIHDLIVYNFSLISKSAGFLFVVSLLIFLFGLLADQIAAIRRQIK